MPSEGGHGNPWEIARFTVLFASTNISMSTQPNCTLYINNLNDKVNKEELRSQLYALFTTYGKVVDIIASKSQKMRGQAFLVFADQGGATSAMRACEGIVFYDKPMVRFSGISYFLSSGTRYS
jgi:RNA recognition motif-containing protein